MPKSTDLHISHSPSPNPLRKRDGLLSTSLKGSCLILGLLAFWGAEFAFAEKESAPPGVERLEAGGLDPDGVSTYWNVVSTTSTVDSSTPQTGLTDFANSLSPLLDKVLVSANPFADVSPQAPLWDGTSFSDGEGEPMPTFWTAPAPATYTVKFKEPIELYYVDLVPPSRKHGFADFSVLVRDLDEPTPSEVRIREATLSPGATSAAGFHWRLEIVPTRAVEVSVRFQRGSLYLPRRIFLMDLDLWGKWVDREERKDRDATGEPN